ncbi:helix-turn-helix domain-containing protein [Domibacillus sp. PGB-M46]|uniref:helix-turn-helix domain-containing protein n=1 Tax=Domibacillus sp. PGB-M46 TaxID=2910255 RepID=UPI001F595BBB|nr:helix-turn-helix transcriptional regulator [Domibacillus sp. PGB-M46]MCI2254226.1 helix-turn-helix domain-containing protein [Domibacillus sp. PGB-M46]
MTIGKKIAEARKRTGHSQRSLSEEEGMAISKESIAKYEAGTRTFPKDMYPRVAQALDDPQFYFEAWEETTGFVNIPYLDGAFIDHRTASLVHLVRMETEKAMRGMEKTYWFKPPDQYSEIEKEEVQKVVKELLDAAVSIMNLVAALCKEHRFSMKLIFCQWRTSLKEKQYEK